LASTVHHLAVAPGLAARGLCKRIAGATVLDGVSITVPAGSLVSVLGPSGSGKTTLLRLLAGFDPPDRGEIEINGVEVSALPPWRRDIGVVFQHYALFPHLTAVDNVAFPLKQRGMARRERAARAQEMLGAVGLPHHAERFPSELSGGEQQRVALARALVFQPRTLLMDEPLAALDRQLRHDMQREIRSLQRRFGVTTLYVTHDQTEAFAISDVIVVMNAGRVEQVGSPRALYESPQTEFVARFVGASNLFRGASVHVDGRPALRLPSGALLRYDEPGASGRAATLVVRPERITITSPESVQAQTNALRGRIQDATFLGEAVEYRVLAEGQEIVVRETIQPGMQLRVHGMDVALTWRVADTIALA
jgi:ABC-type Fe3+/spermidine/putrescine transport system ATPase subunit